MANYTAKISEDLARDIAAGTASIKMESFILDGVECEVCGEPFAQAIGRACKGADQPKLPEVTD